MRADSDVKSVFELGGKTVGTLNQTFAHDILRMMPAVQEVLYEGNEEPYIDLETGRIDAVLLDNIIADRYGCTDKHPTLKCVPYDVARGTYVIGMRKGDAELAAAIDKALADMRADGELQRILEKAHLWDDRQHTATSIGKARAARGARSTSRCSRSSSWAALITLKLTLLAFCIAVPLGMLLAVDAGLRRARSRAARRAVYIELFRGTPVLLQLFVLYYGISGTYQPRAGRGRGDRPGPQLRRVRGRGLPRRAARDPARSDRGGEGARHAAARRPCATSCCPRRCGSRCRR